MLGAVIGDIVGSRFETQTRIDPPTKLFERDCGFTDDSVCIAAVADHLVTGEPLHAAFGRWVRQYPTLEYGVRFKSWALSEQGTVGDSWGNGAAMRVAPVALIAKSVSEVRALARATSACSHNHPLAIGAAEILAVAIYRALQGWGTDRILQQTIAEGLQVRKVAAYRSDAVFSTDAAATIGPALAAALEAKEFEGAMRNGIAIGGDTDTICAMAGGLAEALFGIPPSVLEAARPSLTPNIEASMARLYSKMHGHNSLYPRSHPTV